MKRCKAFIVNGKKYIFDGESVEIVVSPNYTSKSKILNKPNEHRTSHLKSLCLVLNNSCNLCCDYCFANKGVYDKPNEQMTFVTAKKAIDFLVSSATANGTNNVAISFFGGEPLLSFNLIKKCVDFCENTYEGVNFEYMITTNGTLLTPEIVEFMQKHKFDIMISIDGTRELHNFYRKYKSQKGSYDDIVKNINLFRNKKMLNARITITDNNPEIHSYIDSILELGIERITYAVDYNISSDSFSKFLKSLNLLFEKYYHDVSNGKFYDITNFSSVITAIALHQRRLTFCNAGISYLTVSADGSYYRCPRFIGNKDFCLSNVNNSNDALEEMKKFKESLKESPKDL